MPKRQTPSGAGQKRRPATRPRLNGSHSPGGLQADEPVRNEVPLDAPPLLLRLCDVLALLRISKAALYRLIKNYEFPEAVRIGKGSKRWLARAVLEWVGRQS